MAVNKKLLKTFGIDVEKETIETLIESGEKFSREFNCPVEEIHIRIYYNKDGSPYYYLYRYTEGKNVQLRQAQLNEIL